MTKLLKGAIKILLILITTTLAFACNAPLREKQKKNCEHILEVRNSVEYGFDAYIACDLVKWSSERKRILITSTDYLTIAFSGLDKKAFKKQLKYIAQCCCVNERVEGQFDDYIINDSLLNSYQAMPSSQILSRFFLGGINDLDIQSNVEVSAAAFVLLQRGAKIVRHSAAYEMTTPPKGKAIMFIRFE
jgi:hypothetical protein